MQIKQELLLQKAQMSAAKTDLFITKAEYTEQSQKLNELINKAELLSQKLELKIQYFDSIAMSYQHGRLDVVSLILALVTIGLAIASLFGFSAIRTAAKDAAEEEVRNMVKDLFGDASKIAAGPNGATKPIDVSIDKSQEDEILSKAIELTEEGGKNDG